MYASTDVSGTINSNTTWTLSGSPYIIPDGTGVTISNGTTLTIDPGVVVKLGAGSYITGLGKIDALGTADQKIIFTSLDPLLSGGEGSLGANGWYIEMGYSLGPPSYGPYQWNNVVIEHSNGVVFNRGNTSLHAISIKDSDIGIRFVASPTIDLDGVDISHVGSPVRITGSTGTVKNLTAVNSGSLEGVLSIGNSNIVLSDVSISATGIQPAIAMQSANLIGTKLLLSSGVGDGIRMEKNANTGPSTFDLSSSTIENFAGNGVKVIGSILNVHGSRIAHNFSGIYVSDANFGPSAEVEILDSTFENNVFGISNTASFVPEAIGNFWGHESGPFHGFFNPGGKGDAISGSVHFVPWLTSDPVAATQKKIDPVIIIPGLLGSAEKNGVWIIDPIFHVYDNLIATLAANGYTSGKDLFTFPYDWRRSNVDTALDLKTKIDAVKEICKCDKVDLVAHSMGGLVARQYVQSPAYSHDVDQLIFLGTPHLGSPKSYLTWEGGEVDKDIISTSIKFILSREGKKLGYKNLFEYVHNKPIQSISELLSIEDYLHDKNVVGLKVYPHQYPQNIFLENLRRNVSSLLNSDLALTNIIGDTGTTTITSIRLVSSPSLPMWPDGFPEGFNVSTSSDNGLELGRGDATVPLSSSRSIIENSMIKNSEHVSLPTESEGLIYKTLTKKDSVKDYSNSNFPNIKLLFIKVLSPVDIQIISPDGKKIGKNFKTGEEINEIENAFYSGFEGDDEYVTIPDPLGGIYKIETQGMGNGGEYTIASGLISNSGIAENDFVAQTLPGLLSSVDIFISSTSTTPLVVQPEDQIPPTVQIASLKSKYLRSEVLLLSAISTDATGVATSTISFNGKIVANPATIDLFYEKLGTSTVSFYAKDFLGNETTIATSTKIIATADSVLLDISRAYSLGWILNKSIRDILIAEIKFIAKSSQKNQSKLLKLMLEELKLLYPKYINQSAYNLLKEDVQWLLNN